MLPVAMERIASRITKDGFVLVDVLQRERFMLVVFLLCDSVKVFVRGYGGISIEFLWISLIVSIFHNNVSPDPSFSSIVNNFPPITPCSLFRFMMGVVS